MHVYSWTAENWLGERRLNRNQAQFIMRACMHICMGVFTMHCKKTEQPACTQSGTKELLVVLLSCPALWHKLVALTYPAAREANKAPCICIYIYIQSVFHQWLFHFFCFCLELWLRSTRLLKVMAHSSSLPQLHPRPLLSRAGPALTSHKATSINNHLPPPC